VSFLAIARTEFWHPELSYCDLTWILRVYLRMLIRSLRVLWKVMNLMVYLVLLAVHLIRQFVMYPVNC
jgi:hypothetical protein